MSRTITIPDHLYFRLADEARSEGLASVEEWLQNITTILPGQKQPQFSSLPDRSEPPSAAIGHALDEFMGDWSEVESQEFLDDVTIFGQIDQSG